METWGNEWRGEQWVGCEKGKLPILVVIKSGHSGSENCTISHSILILHLDLALISEASISKQGIILCLFVILT